MDASHKTPRDKIRRWLILVSRKQTYMIRVFLTALISGYPIFVAGWLNQWYHNIFCSTKSNTYFDNSYHLGFISYNFYEDTRRVFR